MRKIEILEAYHRGISAYEIGKTRKEVAIEDAYFYMEQET